MTEQQNNEPELAKAAPSISAGAILSQAREAQGIALVDLADQIKVPVSVLEAIEKDRTPKNLPETFIRGYIRSYAKKVGVEEAEVLAAVKTTAAFEVPEMSAQEMQSFSKRTKKQAFERRLKLVSWIILSVLVFAIILWWYQDSNKTDIAPLAGGEETSSTLPVVQEAQLEPLNSEKKTANIEHVESDIDDGFTAQSQNSNSLTVEEAQDTAQTEVTDEPVEVLETNRDSALSNASNSQTLAEKLEAESSAPIELTPDQKALLADVGEADEEGFMKVEMVFENECWVEVYDINDERIAVGNKPAGYTMTLNGQGPFSVLLGNPVGVSIWVDGKRFDTESFPRNRVARFELESTEVATN